MSRDNTTSPPTRQEKGIQVFVYNPGILGIKQQQNTLEEVSKLPASSAEEWAAPSIPRVAQTRPV